MAEAGTIRPVIITGLSGAGKTLVVNCFEDLGYYCVDNLPPALLVKFIELSQQSEGRINRVALVIDARGRQFFRDLFQAIKDLEDARIDCEVVFLEASDDVLVRRFKESRRPHPMASEGRLIESIQLERKLLEELRGRADMVIDTTSLSPRILSDTIAERYGRDDEQRFTLNIVSFGYKAGIPMDSDIVMDVRFLPNPFYLEEMRKMTGRDTPVIDYVMEAAPTRTFLNYFLDLLFYLIPEYINEGKSNLAIAIGCTGGQHRSVVLTDHIGRRLSEAGYGVTIRHRDLVKYIMEASNQDE